MVRIMPPRKRKACTLLSKVTPRVIEMDQRGLALVVSVGQGQAFIGNGGGEGEVAEGKTSSQLLRRSLETLASAGH